MRIAIVEDTPSDYQALRSCLDRYLHAHELDAQVEGFQTADSFFERFSAGLFGLIFCDCYLDEAGLVRDESALNGLEVASRVRETDDAARIIFVTSSRDFAVESYEVRASGYLMKPAQYDDLARVLDRLGLGACKARMIELGGESLDASRLRWARVANHYL